MYADGSRCLRDIRPNRISYANTAAYTGGYINIDSFPYPESNRNPRAHSLSNA